MKARQFIGLRLNCEMLRNAANTKRESYKLRAECRYAHVLPFSSSLGCLLFFFSFFVYICVIVWTGVLLCVCVLQPTTYTVTGTGLYFYCADDDVYALCIYQRDRLTRNRLWMRAPCACACLSSYCGICCAGKRDIFLHSHAHRHTKNHFIFRV